MCISEYLYFDMCVCVCIYIYIYIYIHAYTGHLHTHMCIHLLVIHLIQIHKETSGRRGLTEAGLAGGRPSRCVELGSGRRKSDHGRAGLHHQGIRPQWSACQELGEAQGCGACAVLRWRLLVLVFG
jgi:hypothetical protein